MSAIVSITDGKADILLCLIGADFVAKVLLHSSSKFSFGCTRDFRVKMWGTSSPDDKLTDDLRNAIEGTRISGRRWSFLTAEKLAPSDLGLLQQYPSVSGHNNVSSGPCGLRCRGKRSLRAQYPEARIRSRLEYSLSDSTDSSSWHCPCIIISDDLYSEVSARIVAALKCGAAPWIKPWSAAKL